MSHEPLPAVRVADLLEPLPEAHVVIDLVGLIVYLNPSAERLLGYRRGTLVGRDLRVLLGDGQDPSELIGRFAGSATLRPARIVLADGRRLRCDGTRLPHKPLVQLRLRDHDEAAAPFLQINDQVETRSLRELSSRLDRSVIELRAANQRLGAANEEIRQYAQAVAHDFRNPLFTIQGLAHLLTDDLPHDSEAASYVKLILESCDRLQAAAEGVLSVARVERATPPPATVDTNAIVSEALADLADELSRLDAELVVEPLHPVAVDPTGLRRVVQNLIANSLRHAPVPDRALRIEVSSRRVDALVELTVADNGAGIAAAERERVFDLFHRGGRAAQRPGAGIGLASCRKTVTAWGGTITCKTRQGPGIQFVLTAPAAQGPPARSAPPTGTRRQHDRADADPSNWDPSS